MHSTSSGAACAQTRPLFGKPGHYQLLADSTVEARRFLASVRQRTLRTASGKPITTTDLAEALVKRAELEHAIVKGKRPSSIVCASKKCGVVVKVKKKGPVPAMCRGCARAEQTRKQRAKRPRTEAQKAKDVARSKAYKKADPARANAAERRRRAKQKAGKTSA